MSLRPIDLQNLFVHLNQVGREQAAREEAPLHAQQVAAEEIKEETRQFGEKVQATEETSSGAEKIHDEQSGRQEEEAFQEGEEGEEANQEENKSDDPFRDPDLGNKIDIRG